MRGSKFHTFMSYVVHLYPMYCGIIVGLFSWGAYQSFGEANWLPFASYIIAIVAHSYFGVAIAIRNRNLYMLLEKTSNEFLESVRKSNNEFLKSVITDLGLRH